MSVNSGSAYRKHGTCVWSFPQYQSLAEMYGCPFVHKSYMSDYFGRSSGLYYHDLMGHYGCVNAIEFSNSGGEFIVSGGDDRRVFVWNVEKCVYGSSLPAVMKGEHRSNIFCTVFDNDNSHIFSAGNDNQALRHDFLTGEAVGMYYHDDPVYGLNVHPENSNVFLTASDDGKVLLWDIRTSPLSGSSSCIAQYESAFHAAVFNPVDCNLIATANSRKGVQLWDIRAPISCLRQFSSGIAQMCAMGLKWNTTGDMITALRRRLPPVLYHIKQAAAIAEFHHPGYSNVCTMKSNCFAGSKDQYIVSGSDDFNVYVWEVPDDWADQDKLVTVGRAFLVLHGHRSIVNQVRFNSATHMLMSAGVEKVLKVWSPFPIPGGHSSVDGCQGSARELYSHSDYLGFIRYGGLPLSHDEYNNRSTEEDPRMLAFFDSLIQREKDNLHSDSDDSIWDDFHLSFILQAGSSDSSGSDTVETNVSRLIAREILHRSGRGSPDRDAAANSSVLRRLRHLRDTAVIRDLLNADTSSSDEETERNTNTNMNEPSRDLDNRQSSSHSASVVFNRHRRRANRRYRSHNRERGENETSSSRQVMNNSSSSDSEDKVTLQRITEKTEEQSNGSDTEDSKQNVESDSDEATEVQKETMTRELNGQSSADIVETRETLCRTNESNKQTITDRANGNTQMTFNHKNEKRASVRTDASCSCESNHLITSQDVGNDGSEVGEERQYFPEDNE